jgi:hypothetical protein
LPAVLPRCSHGLGPGEGGWKMLPRGLSGQAAQHRDRNRSPGRTRVHPVSRPRSDLDGGATGPRRLRRVRWGSARPERDLATALQRAGRAGSVQVGVASPRLVSLSVLRSSLLRRDGPESLSRSHESQVCAACPALHRPLEPVRVRGGNASRNDAASAGPATSSPGHPAASSRGGRGESGLPGRMAVRRVPASLLQGSATSKNRAG